MLPMKAYIYNVCCCSSQTTDTICSFSWTGVVGCAVQKVGSKSGNGHSIGGKVDCPWVCQMLSQVYNWSAAYNTDSVTIMQLVYYRQAQPGDAPVARNKTMQKLHLRKLMHKALLIISLCLYMPQTEATCWVAHLWLNTEQQSPRKRALQVVRSSVPWLSTLPSCPCSSQEGQMHHLQTITVFIVVMYLFCQ